jgi:hypothetical protein
MFIQSWGKGKVELLILKATFTKILIQNALGKTGICNNFPF